MKILQKQRHKKFFMAQHGKDLEEFFDDFYEEYLEGQPFPEYMSIKEAAAYLDVNKNTLLNWEKAGKIKVCRNPMSNYRMYKIVELEAILESIKLSLG